MKIVFVENALAVFMFHLYISDVLSKWFYLVGWLKLQHYGVVDFSFVFFLFWASASVRISYGVRNIF